MKQQPGREHPPPLISFLVPGLGEIVFIAVFVAVLSMGPALFNMDGDLGRHITIGNDILDGGAIPKTDRFSHTLAGEPLTPHEWLAQVIFAFFHRIAGFDGLVWLTAVGIAATFWIVYERSFQSSHGVLTAAGWTIAAAAASSLHWLVRPHLFTMLLLGIWVRILEQRGDKPSQKIIWLALLMLVWVNLHGAFLVGVMVWLMYFAGDLLESGLQRRRIVRWGISGLILFGVTLCNPVGLQIWETGFGFLGNRYLVSHTAEYLPPDFQHPSAWPFLLMLVGSIFIFGQTKNRIKPAEAILMSGWTAMSLYSARNIPLYSVIAAPILAKASSGMLKDWENHPWIEKLQAFQQRAAHLQADLKKGVWAVVFVIVLGALSASSEYKPGFLPENRYLPDRFPVDAVNWLEKNPQQGKMFNYFPWGGYLLFRLWPEEKVFIDGQTDFYGEALTREYEEVITLTGNWEEILDDYQIRTVIMPANSRLIHELSSRNDWTVSYQDDTAVILQYPSVPE